MDVYRYTKKIQDSAKAGNMDGAVILFSNMKKEGVQPNVVTYNVMMDAFSRNGIPDAVHQLYDEMIDAEIEPNVYIFNTALRACAINAELDRAEHLLTRMQRQYGLKPDTTTYGALLHICAAVGELSLAKQIFERMMKEDVPRNVVIYNCLIDAHAEATDKRKGWKYYKRCTDLVESMKKEQIVPNARTHCALMKLCVRGGLMQEALNIVPEMDGIDAHATVVAFGTLLDGLIRSPSLSIRIKSSMLNWMLSEMARLKLMPDLKMYTMLFNLCSMLRDLSLAEGFFRQLKEEGLKPNVMCYRAIISCYEVLGDRTNKEEYLKPCFDLVKEMEITGVELNADICLSLVNACSNVKDIDRGLEVWDKARNLRITDYPRIFRAIVHDYLQANEVDRALAFVNKQEMKSLLRDKRMLQMLTEYFTTRKMHDRQQQFLKNLRDKGVDVNP